MAKKVKTRKRMAKVTSLARVDRPLASEGTSLSVFERMARDPDITVDQLGELIRLHERQEERAADKAFDAAYRVMLPEIPRIKKNGKILNKQKEIQSRYAKYEDIRRFVDPIMLRHGFTFHTHTEWPAPGLGMVIGTLEHSAGGKRSSTFQFKGDASGGKNEIQGLGSGVSYGKRYTLKDLLSIIEEGEDDDGQNHGRTQGKRAEVIDVPATGPAERAAGWDKGRGEPISDGQLRRFHVVVGNSGRNDVEIKTWLKQRFGWDSSRQITRDKYDAICNAIEAPGTLA